MMAVEFTLIDVRTRELYGPFDTFAEARCKAEAFDEWEIIDHEGRIYDWINAPRPYHASRCAEF